jgi:hypothetical protein
VDDLYEVKIYDMAADVLRYTGVSGAGGVIVITTKKGVNNVEASLTSSKTCSFLGYSPSKNFESPDYSKATDAANATTDNRSTLLWQPDIRTGKDGKASLQFYTSDKKGRYIGTIQGIAGNGSPVYGRFEFDVK